MRLCYITAYFLPYHSAGTERSLGYINSIRTDDSLEIVFPLFEDEAFNESHNTKNNVTYCPVRINSNRYNKNFFIRLFVETKTCIFLLLAAKKVNQIDKFIVTTPYLSMIFLAAMILSRNKLILEIRDSTWDYFRNKFLRATLTIFVHLFINLFKLVITVTDEQLNMLPSYIKKNGLVAINGVAKSKYEKIIATVPSRVSSDTYNLYYCGSLGFGQNISTLVDKLKDINQVKIKIRGTGLEYTKIKEYIDVNEISNIFLHEYSEFNKVLDDYNWADYLIVSLDARFSSAIPSKIYEYLATKRKILCFCPTDSAIRKLESRNIIFFDIPSLLDRSSMESLAELIYNDEYKIDKNFDMRHIREHSISKLLKEIHA